jgi:hypothetical protein
MSYLAVIGAVALAAGCGKKVEKKVPVAGTVLLDKLPMKDGEIAFISGAGGAIPEILEVKDGAFKGEVTAGSKRVEIRAYKEVASTGGGMYKPGEIPGSGTARENFLPDRFNVTSDLGVVIKSEGGNDNLKFEVQSK